MQFQKDSNNNRIRQRRVYIQDNTPESEPGDIIYGDPNGNQVFSPNQDSPEQYYDFNEGEPSSIPNKTRSVFQKDQGFPSLFVNSNSTQGNPNPKYQRSPHLYNMGSSRDDNDYNMPTINSRKSPNNVMYNINRDSNDDYLHSPYEDDDYQAYPRESQRTGMFFRDRSPVINLNKRNNKNISPYGRPGVIPINKMSPEQNYEESNYSAEKQSQERTAKFNNLKNYLGKNNLYKTENNSYYNPNYINTNTTPNQNQTMQNAQMLNVPPQDDVNDKYNNRTYNNMSYRDIKRIANRFTKVYDPNKNNNGLLIEETQITVPGAQDDIFNNRYRVLAKMNRLSNILLAKQGRRNSPNRGYNDHPFENRSYNKYNRDRSYNGKIKKPFDRHTLARSPGDNSNIRKAFSRSPEHKFLYVSLAMISSKGPSCEDRPILRRMRLDKGGVVDLAQEERKKTKFKIKNTQRKKGFKRNYFMNPKYREKAARIIQNWWKELKNIFNYRMKQIIKIQSAFRGKFVRKYMYDLFYLNFLYISFCKKIENVLRNHVKPYVFRKLMGKNVEDTIPKEESPVPDKEILLGRILSRDYRNDLNTIYPSWKKWMANTRRINDKNMRY